MTPFSSMLWVMVGGVIGSFGAVGLKAGAGRLKLDIKSLATNWQLIGGVFAYLVSSVLFVKGMNQGQLSVLYPIVAMGQIWTLLWSRLFFGEHITRHKLIAVALILAGVSLVGIGSN
ncbi:MAG: EamA family transporter [Nitrospiria bacterium]